MLAKSIGDSQTCDAGAAQEVPALPHGVEPGARVDVRGAAWSLDATVLHADCRELHLSGARDRDACVLLWPFDRPAPVRRDRTIKVVRLRRWWREVAPLFSRAVDPATPRVRNSGADLLPYQLAPAAAAAAGTPRLLLADEVGLGKTIQAGWIVADRLARTPDARVLIAVPAGVRHQWASELTRFFAIQPAVTTAQWLRRAVASLPADVSPWTPPGVYVGSIDFLKRHDVARALARCVWDLLVIDEAHTAAAPTERFAALQQIASEARQIVLITATPYSGDAESFASMARLGDVEDEPPLMFRRSREDAGDGRARRHRFALVTLTPAEQRLQRLLERYSRDVWRQAPGDIEGARLAVTILRKRALSSPASAARSLSRRLDLLQGAALVPRQLSLLDEEDDIGGEDDLLHSALAVPGLADAVQERRTLTVLIEAARRATGSDSKLRRLVSLLRRLRGEPALVFTEYRDTLMHLQAALPPSLQLHGGLSATERADVQARFNLTGGVLLATDAASHGLNLQQRCRVVINYELPWNPARLEQRIGRLDRIGQRRTVHAITLVARDTAEDLVVSKLAGRLRRVAAALGERDRLASFLTDARTAGIVIGGDEAPSDRNPPVMPVARAVGFDELASAAADRLRLARAIPTSARCAEHILLASATRASAALREGVVFILRCVASTEDGDIAGERTLSIHVPARHAKAARAVDVRLRVGAVLDSIGGDLAGAAASIVQGWYEGVRRTHGVIVDRRIARDSALMRRSPRTAALQPGLFDRRAQREFDAAADARRSMDEDHQRHIAALARARDVRLTCTIVAALVLWR